MKKTIAVYTNWDAKRKAGGWSARCGSHIISGIQYNTTSDKLVLTGLIEGVKEFSLPGDDLTLVTTNSRVKHAVRHPSASIHCATARQFRAIARSANIHYRLP